MTLALGTVPAGTTIYIPFSSYAGATGASVTMTGLAVTDIEIYKNGSPTQRSSDAGYTLLDTDGIDFDGITGLHGFSIDLSDNTDSGFFSVGAWYMVAVSAVTIDGQTVNFWAAVFRIGPAESVAGYPKADVSHWLGTAAATPATAGHPVVTLKVGTGTGEVNVASGVVPANMTQISGDATAADNLEAAYDDTAGAVPWLGIIDQGTAQAATSTTLQLRSAAGFADDELIGSVIVITGGSAGIGQSRVITDYVSSTDTATVAAWTVTPTGTITYKIFASPPSDGVIDTMAATIAKLNDTLEDNVGTYRFTSAALAAGDDAVLAQIALVKAKTDSLTFTVAGVVDANMQRINDVSLVGDGSGTPFQV